MRVLVAVEDRSVSRVVEEALDRRGDTVVATADAALARRVLLDDHPPRLAVLGWKLGKTSAASLCREVRRQPQGQFIYLLLLLTEGQRPRLVEGLRAGADNCLIEPLGMEELTARLKAARRILEAQDQLIVARQAFEDQALHDPLTGLWNHRAILQTLERELARGRRECKPVGVLLADLDHFKQVNDSYGHLVGDATLREAARRIQAAIRPYDLVGRYGGEEFLVVLPGCDVPSMVGLGERVRGQLGDRAFEVPEGAIPVTISVGVAASDRANTVPLRSLLRAADAALYRAKDRGRNRVEAGCPEGEGVLTV